MTGPHEAAVFPNERICVWASHCTDRKKPGASKGALGITETDLGSGACTGGIGLPAGMGGEFGFRPI